MSEYKEFLSYFKSKRRADASAEKNAAPSPGEPSPTEEGVAQPAEEARQPEPEAAFTPVAERLIRTGEAEPIPTEEGAAASSETEIGTFADRLEAEGAEERAHTGYTGKIDTVSANAAEGDGDGTRELEPSVFEASLATRAFNGDGTKAVDPSAFASADPDPDGAAPGSEGLTRDYGPIRAAQTPDPPTRTIPAGGTEALDPPTKAIPADKGSLLVEIAKSGAEETGEDPEQLELEGFFEQEKKPEPAPAPAPAPEDPELQSELKKVRQRLIQNFHFWTKAKTEPGKIPDDAFGSEDEKKPPLKLFGGLADRFASMEGGFLPFRCEEFKDPNSHRDMFKKLMDIRRYTLARAGVVFLLGLVLFIINIAASVSAARHNGFFTILGGSDAAYLTANLLFLAAAALLTAGDLKNGFVSLMQGHPKTDASLVFMMSAALLQVIAAFFTEQNIESAFHMMTGAVVMLCAPLLLAKTFYYDSTRHCFKCIAANSEKSYLRTVSDRGLISSVLAGSAREDAQVVYPGRTRFIKNFIKRSRASAAGGQISSRVTLIAAGVAFLTGVLAMIVRRNVMWGLSAMCFSSALAFPLGCVFFTGFMIANENKALSVKSSFVRSYSDARDLASVDNIVLRAEDLFDVQITETVCAANVSQKQAEFCAGLLTQKTGGLLEKAFCGAEGLQMENLPEVEKCAYEDKLGFSAWVKDCRVLLGSNTFLVNHNVRMPDESGVLNFIDTENKPVYLAIEGHFTAMFSARYSCASEYVKCLKPLADNGANILIVSTDPNITDGFAEQLLGLPADSVRVISRKAADRLTFHQNTVTDAEDTGIVFTEDPESLCRCAYSAVKLDKLKKLAKLICEICCCAGVALGTVFALTGNVSAISGWLIAVLQAMGMALCFFLPPLLTASSLPAFRKSAVRPVPVSEPVTPEDYPPRPRKIEDEPDVPEEPEAPPAEETGPETDDGDVKIAPESGRKKSRFSRALSAIQLKDKDFEDYDSDGDDEDDDFGAPRRPGRFSSALKPRFGKQKTEETDTGYEEDGYGAEEEEAAEPAPEREGASFGGVVIPEDPDDIHISTEELLKSRFFDDEDESAARREPSPANEFEEEAYDEEDAYGDYGDGEDGEPVRDGLLSRVKAGREPDGRRDGWPGGRQPHERSPHGLADKVKGLSSKLPFPGRNGAEDDDWDEDWDEETEAIDLPEERRTFLTSSAPAVGGSRREEPAEESASSLRPSILSFAQPDPVPPKYDLGKTDEYDFLNVKFEPPAVSTSEFYGDSYFRRYETPDAPAAPGGAAEGETPDAAVPEAAPAERKEPAIAGKRRGSKKKRP